MTAVLTRSRPSALCASQLHVDWAESCGRYWKDAIKAQPSSVQWVSEFGSLLW